MYSIILSIHTSLELATASHSKRHGDRFPVSVSFGINFVEELLYLAGHHGHLQFTNRLGNLDIAWAGIGAVESGMAARHSIGLAQDLQALGSGFVAAIENKAMR